MPRPRNAFETASARAIETAGSETPVRKRKKAELLITVNVENALQAEKAKSAELYQEYNQRFEAYLREKSGKKPNAAKLQELKGKADEAQKAFRTQKNKEYDLALRLQKDERGLEGPAEPVAKERMPSDVREIEPARRDLIKKLDAHLKKRAGIWEMTETYKQTPIDLRLENAREAKEWQEQLENARREAKTNLEEELRAAKASGLNDEAFYRTYLARLNAQVLDRETPEWMKKYLRVEKNRVEKELRPFQKPEAAIPLMRKKEKAITVEQEAPEVTLKDTTMKEAAAIREIARLEEERKTAQSEISSLKKTLKEIEQGLSRYGDPFELANGLARPKLGLRERFDGFLRRITGQLPAADSYDQLLSEWNIHTAHLETLELKLDAVKRGEAAAKKSGELTEQNIKDVLAKMKSEESLPARRWRAPRGMVGRYGRGSGYTGGGIGTVEKAFERRGAVSAAELSPASSELVHVLTEEERRELADLRDLADAAVMSYETKREDGTLRLESVASLERTLKDLDKRVLKLLGEQPPYNQDVANLKFHLQEMQETLQQAKERLKAQKPSERSTEGIEGAGGMREAEKTEESIEPEEMKRLVPDEIFRYNKFKQAFLERFRVHAKDGEKKREQVARKKTEAYARLGEILDAKEGTDLADIYVKRLAEYRKLGERLAMAPSAARAGMEARHARLQSGLSAVQRELGLAYGQAERRKEAAS